MAANPANHGTSGIAASVALDEQHVETQGHVLK